MAMYLGGTKCNIVLGNIIYDIKLHFSTPIINSAFLLSSDNYVLQDCAGIYLIPDDDFVVNNTLLLLKDGCVLKDKNHLYLTIKEVE